MRNTRLLAWRFRLRTRAASAHGACAVHPDITLEQIPTDQVARLPVLHKAEAACLSGKAPLLVRGRFCSTNEETLAMSRSTANIPPYGVAIQSAIKQGDVQHMKTLLQQRDTSKPEAQDLKDAYEKLAREVSRHEKS